MDIQRSTSRSAVRNAEIAGLAERCRFSQESAAKAARRLLAEKATFDCLLLDPPRSGCAELIPLLPGLKARQIIYISVDMFPQTAHQETMVRLERE